jgi:antitoxin ParD1/3/4
MPRPAKTTSISLGEEFVLFIESMLATGRYGSASEVVRAALRDLQDKESERASLISSDTGKRRGEHRK